MVHQHHLASILVSPSEALSFFCEVFLISSVVTGIRDMRALWQGVESHETSTEMEQQTARIELAKGSEASPARGLLWGPLRRRSRNRDLHFGVLPHCVTKSHGASSVWAACDQVEIWVMEA